MDDTIEEKYKEIHMSFLNVVIETMNKLKEDSNIITESMERVHLEGR